MKRILGSLRACTPPPKAEPSPVDIKAEKGEGKEEEEKVNGKRPIQRLSRVELVGFHGDGLRCDGWDFGTVW